MNPDYNTLLRFYNNAMSQQSNQFTQGVLPPQNVIQVNGKSSINALRMSPNSSVLLMDSTAPIVWLCTSDGLGNVTSKPYDIHEHVDQPPVNVDNLEMRISNIETVLTNLLGGDKNAKSNDESVKHREDEVSS